MRGRNRVLLAALLTPLLALECGGEDDHAVTPDAAVVDATKARDALDEPKVDSTSESDASTSVRFCDSPEATPHRYCIDFDDPIDPLPFDLRRVTDHATLDVDPSTYVSAPGSARMWTPYVVPGGAVLPGVDAASSLDSGFLAFDAGWGSDAGPRDLGVGISRVDHGGIRTGLTGVSSQLDVRLDTVSAAVPAGASLAEIWGEDLAATSFWVLIQPGAPGEPVSLRFRYRTSWDGALDGATPGVPNDEELFEFPVTEGLDLGVWTRLIVTERFTPNVGLSGDVSVDITLDKEVPPGAGRHTIFTYHRGSTLADGVLFLAAGLRASPYVAPQAAHYDNILIRDLP